MANEPKPTEPIPDPYAEDRKPIDFGTPTNRPPVWELLGVNPNKAARMREMRKNRPPGSDR